MTGEGQIRSKGCARTKKTELAIQVIWIVIWRVPGKLIFLGECLEADTVNQRSMLPTWP
jgi:hypothetical protein